MNVEFRAMVPTDLKTVLEHMPFSATTDTRGIVAYDPETAETLALFMAQEWTATSVQVHQVILNKMVMRHGWFEEIADYIFGSAGRLKMYGLIPSNNEKAISVNEKIGFKELIRLEDAYDHDIDFVVMELKREDCPYWGKMAEAA